MLAPGELSLIWTIDRRERIEHIYRLQDGHLVLEPHHFQVPGWPPGHPEHYGPAFETYCARGAHVHGAFDGETLAGVAVADTARVASLSDLVELKFLHVSAPFRGTGVGARLFGLAADSAREFGAQGLYISATPTQNTVDFYRARGSTVLATPDPELFALEPEDIHLEWRP